MKLSNAENELLNELNNVIKHSKQRIAIELGQLSKSSLDVSKKDYGTILESLQLSLDKVYRDVAPSFIKIKESIKSDKKLIKESSSNKK